MAVMNSSDSLNSMMTPFRKSFLIYLVFASFSSFFMENIKYVIFFSSLEL